MVIGVLLGTLSAFLLASLITYLNVSEAKLISDAMARLHMIEEGRMSKFEELKSKGYTFAPDDEQVFNACVAWTEDIEREELFNTFDLAADYARDANENTVFGFKRHPLEVNWELKLDDVAVSIYDEQPPVDYWDITPEIHEAWKVFRDAFERDYQRYECEWCLIVTLPKGYSK